MADIVKAAERRNKINNLISQAEWRENQMKHFQEQEKIASANRKNS